MSPMKRRHAVRAAGAAGALGLLGLSSGCGKQRLRTDPEAPRCLRYVGFPEARVGWKLQTYAIPTVGTVVLIEYAGRGRREALPNGDVRYTGPLTYGIPEFYDFSNLHYEPGKLNIDTREGSVTLRNPKNQDPHAAFAPLLREGLARPLHDGWVIAEVDIPTRGDIERIWVPAGSGGMHNGKLTFAPVSYRISPNLDTDRPSYLPQNLAERERLLSDPRYWTDERGHVAFRRPDC